MNLNAINEVQINERPSQVPKNASTISGVIIKLIIFYHLEIKDTIDFKLK